MAKKQVVTLVMSDSKSPAIKVKAGQRLEVVAVNLVKAGMFKPRPKGARLCGGSSTCLAIVDVS